MNFKTAIFYDIENLIKGYSNYQNPSLNVSLKEILESIKAEVDLDGIAIQKAYANWSNPKLAGMRFEINELGIEPVQVFGFSRDSKKNAADIQLAIDAIDIAHTRPFIEKFVIISGDGGFSALAKKIREYGKSVVGSAYKSTTNTVFKAVCDQFIFIRDPEEATDDFSGEIPQEIPFDPPQRPSYPSYSYNEKRINDPRNQRLVKKIEPVGGFSQDEIIAKSREILDWYKNDQIGHDELQTSGIVFPVFQEAIKYLVPGFQQGNIGFPKFIEYMQYLCTNTDLCVARPPSSAVVLIFRANVPKDWDVLPDISTRSIHSPETYRAALAKGWPAFRLPAPKELKAAIEWVCANGRSRGSFYQILDFMSEELYQIPRESLKQALFVLINAEIFIREPENAPTTEQILRLRPEMSSSEMIYENLKIELYRKLEQSMSDIRSELISEMLTVI